MSEVHLFLNFMKLSLAFSPRVNRGTERLHNSPKITEQGSGRLGSKPRQDAAIKFNRLTEMLEQRNDSGEPFRVFREKRKEENVSLCTLMVESYAGNGQKLPRFGNKHKSTVSFFCTWFTEY